MVRESGISATKPIFPTYLLPSLSLPLRFRRRASSASSVPSLSNSTSTSPSSSPPPPTILPCKLQRVAPDTLRCQHCSSDIALSAQIISKGFTGRHGRAFLVGPDEGGGLMNIRQGRSESRQLVTGWHTVADISCGTCASKLGWKYVDARESAQKYKVGKYILETERVVVSRSWEDVPVLMGSQEVRHGEAKRREEEGGVVFDSDDDDECEDIFSGVWDRDVVARRRRGTQSTRRDDDGE
ncbi:uncharacterized protein J7T54_003484 [Emericellopsis cladophorae]|uniref:Yippee domain-containing protein n=1 Tax=Emericellopsis cladophorae TaxID=2686198 RepID=A0A9P9Y2C1_9HYPO|nr:uncharacterized protein J7T54_003484 [Emericellopsis cladophorae]KAI6782065.1 hypothetical protein J7T54_003484 [Emericellopsis cladophorae]